ncbi:hypothetical protein EPA93_37520 [Ktedonosporobacter rubrisoli]|uniref:Zf-HC2 domain-containing protein n=1 Tax=Ktedonosporobacter rubrisoli TaxID=2509675 RepID=A0A4P6K0Q3_KTERU|nr:hypothetical protein [Ktedonosporobacter rubrisoli]QBD81372.1 hypothetical protein EPA93_37520 [Ktedonosporobacter rubrisoli]
MNNTDLPPLPPKGTLGAEVCANVRIYLAVWEDLSPEQKQAANEHVELCTDCAREYAQMRKITRMVASIETSSPSAHVDRAVMEAIKARSGRPQRSRRASPAGKRIAFPLAGLVAAAVLLFALLSLFSGPLGLPFGGIFPGGGQQAFALPAKLSWSGYVLHYTQTKMSSDGKAMHINSYHELATGNMHVETKMDNDLDVVLVANPHEALGMDKMHHVAQWDAQAWSPDDSMFNLQDLRSDLQSKRAVYLGTANFQNQEVYRIRVENGLVLLLNKQYQPVNVLEGSGKPMYDTVNLMPSSQVPDATWDMKVPANYTMGKLPAKP